MKYSKKNIYIFKVYTLEVFQLRNRVIIFFVSMMRQISSRFMLDLVKIYVSLELALNDMSKRTHFNNFVFISRNSSLFISQ